MKKIINLLLTGLAVVLPLFLTFFIIYKFFIFVDNFLVDIIASILGFKIIGLGFLTTVIIIFLTGLIVRNYAGEKILNTIEKILKKVPLIYTIYQTFKEISDSFLNKKKNNFKNPVLIEFPSKGIQSIGFITNNEVIIENKKYITVFIPTTPNPTNGFLVLVKENEVHYLDINTQKATKSIISLGTIMPKNIKFLNKKTPNEI